LGVVVVGQMWKQGYLGLVLSFEYQMAVVAVDACAHHSNVTNERATRIEKHYNAQLHKTQQGVRLFL
jgi:hypothetical protein